MMDTSTPDSLIFSAVPAAVLDVVWADAEPLLAKAVEASGGRYTTQSVYEGLRNQHLLLWMVMDGTKPVAALTTRVSQLPTVRALSIDWLGGERMKEWLPIIMPVLVQYGKQYSCTEMHGYGRLAWSRWLAPHGWAQDYIAYKREINDE